jgi:formamidopyrimidine-DNA glycosylase
MKDDVYYAAAKEAVGPLSDGFDYAYFLTLFHEKSLKMSAKAFLATEQRIPGLGNGVLQDILLNAGIHPKRKMHTLSEEQRRGLFDSIKSTLADMVKGGGRDTEKDLFGSFGGYETKLSKKTALSLCPRCGGPVKKEAYMGGSIYVCEQCQQL